MPLDTGRNVVVHPCKFFLVHPRQRHSVVANFEVRFFENFQKLFRRFASPCSNVGAMTQLWERNDFLPVVRCRDGDAFGFCRLVTM